MCNISLFFWYKNREFKQYLCILFWFFNTDSSFYKRFLNEFMEKISAISLFFTILLTESADKIFPECSCNSLLP